MAAECLWLDAACHSFDVDRPYALLSQVVGKLAEVETADDEAERYRKVRVLVQNTYANLGPSGDDQIDAGVALLGQTIGVHVAVTAIDVAEAELQQRNLARVLQRVLSHTATDRPLVLALDDLQWIDRDSLAVLDQLARAVGRLRLLILISYRSEWSHPWSSLSHYRQQPLIELDEEGRRALLARLLGVESAPAAVADPILERLARLFTTAQSKDTANPVLLATFGLYIHGASRGEIAQQLGRSESTIRNYITYIYECFDLAHTGSRLRRRARLVEIARREGYIL